MPTAIRMFDGEAFRWAGHTSKKKKAFSVAARIRKKGKKARVVRGQIRVGARMTSKYLVYVR